MNGDKVRVSKTPALLNDSARGKPVIVLFTGKKRNEQQDDQQVTHYSVLQVDNGILVFVALSLSKCWQVDLRHHAPGTSAAIGFNGGEG